MARGGCFRLDSRVYPFLTPNGPGIPVFGYRPLGHQRGIEPGTLVVVVAVLLRLLLLLLLLVVVVVMMCVLFSTLPHHHDSV